MKKIKRIFALFLCVMLFVTSTMNVDAANKKYSKEVKVSARGEYNITVKGNLKAKPVLYKKNALGKKTKVSGTKVEKSSGKWVIECGLEKNKKYCVDYTATSGTPTVTTKKNLDKYSTSSSKCTKGVTWTPKNESYQEFQAKNIYTVQIVYMTKEEAALYSLNLSKNQYLKLIDTGVKLSAVLASAGIPANSTLGKAVTKIGKNNLANVAKTIATTYGGIQLVPSMKDFVQDAVEEASKNYTTGVKMTITHTQRGGYSNTYESWNGKKSSVQGKSGCRGTFSTKAKIKGWY